MLRQLSKLIRSLPLFNPFEKCDESLQPLPWFKPIPTAVVEQFWNIFIWVFTFAMVAIVLDYISGRDDVIKGVVGYCFLWIINSVTMKLIVESAGSWLWFLLIVGAYITLIKFLSTGFHNYDVAPSAPPPRAQKNEQ